MDAWFALTVAFMCVWMEMRDGYGAPFALQHQLEVGRYSIICSLASPSHCLHIELWRFRRHAGWEGRCDILGLAEDCWAHLWLGEEDTVLGSR